MPKTKTSDTLLRVYLDELNGAIDVTKTYMERARPNPNRINVAHVTLDTVEALQAARDELDRAILAARELTAAKGLSF